jgi:hypothetical protein
MKAPGTCCLSKTAVAAADATATAVIVIWRQALRPLRFIRLARIALPVLTALLTCGAVQAQVHPPTGGAVARGSAVATVLAKVDPYVAVRAGTPVVRAPARVGDFDALITFHIDSNCDRLLLSVDASDLYKGSDPNNSLVPPIPLNTSAGITLMAGNANPLGGASNTLVYSGTSTIGNFPARTTTPIAFESSQNGHFTQDVIAVVTWTQAEPDKPAGEYGGKVRLNAMVMPAQH